VGILVRRPAQREKAACPDPEGAPAEHSPRCRNERPSALHPRGRGAAGLQLDKLLYETGAARRETSKRADHLALLLSAPLSAKEPFHESAYRSDIL